MRSVIICFLAATLALLSAASLTAQSVRWDPSSGSLAIGQHNGLQLIFENCRPTASLSLPKIPQLDLNATNQTGSSTEIVNGQATTTAFIVCTARPHTRDRVTIPAFTVETDKGRLTVPPVSFTVGDATVGQSSLSIDTVSNSRLTVPREVWAGEVFPIVHSISTIRRYLHDIGSHFEWDAAPMVTEAFPPSRQISERMENGERRLIATTATRGVIKQPGEHTLNPANASVQLVTGTSAFGLFSRPNIDQYLIATDRPTIRVKALPTQAPSSFRGAVGQFKLESKVVPTEVTTGEPVTWTLSLRGTGNWPDIPSLPPREVAKDFRPVQTQPRREIAQDKLFEGTLTEDVVLIPTKAGTYTIGPLSWSSFDPAKGVYQTVTTDAVTVTVAGAPMAPTATTAQPPADTGLSATPSPQSLTPPPPPAAIPGDPLDGSEVVRTPLRGSSLLALVLSPIVPVLALWLAFALRRARQNDPLRDQRAAHARLRHTLATLALQRADRAQAAVLLQQWQRDAAVLWQLPHVAPPPVEFRRLAAKNPSLAEASEWSRLVDEAERALYRRDYELPADWIARAQVALTQKRIHAFSPVALFRPQNLLPFAALLALAATLAPTPGRAESARELYQKGDFAGAEQAWRKEVVAQPTDWRARYNLSLALAQLDRWGESAAHASAAFVQRPGDEAVRQHMTLALKHAGYTSVIAQPFDTSSSAHAAVRMLSPTGWQNVLVVSSAVFCAVLAAILLRAYTRRFGWLIAIFVSLCPGALLLALVSGYALRAYSPLNDERAVLVWKSTTLKSIPTDVDTPQKTTSIGAGSVAIVDHAFLGWSRLRFTDGQTGWVRQENLVGIWR